MDAERPARTGAKAVPDLDALAATRMREYVEVWEGAVAKMMEGSYRSEDLLDDSFKVWGKMARDFTAAAALLWGAAGADREADDRPGR